MVGVSKTYRRRGRNPQKALDGLDLLVESGGVHGLPGAERVGQDDAGVVVPADHSRY